MKIKELINFIAKRGRRLKDIEIEDYNGNTLCFLKDLDIADIEVNILRLQLNKK